MNDDFTLQEIAASRGRRAPNGEEQRRQYLRLIEEGYLRRVPVKPLAGDMGDPLVCELTAEGRQKIDHR
jgi:hypothetical protein